MVQTVGTLVHPPGRHPNPRRAAIDSCLNSEQSAALLPLLVCRHRKPAISRNAGGPRQCVLGRSGALRRLLPATALLRLGLRRSRAPRQCWPPPTRPGPFRRLGRRPPGHSARLPASPPRQPPGRCAPGRTPGGRRRRPGPRSGPAAGHPAPGRIAPARRRSLRRGFRARAHLRSHQARSDSLGSAGNSSRRPDCGSSRAGQMTSMAVSSPRSDGTLIPAAGQQRRHQRRCRTGPFCAPPGHHPRRGDPCIPGDRGCVRKSTGTVQLSPVRSWCARSPSGTPCHCLQPAGITRPAGSNWITGYRPLPCRTL